MEEEVNKEKELEIGPRSVTDQSDIIWLGHRTKLVSFYL